MQNNFISFKSVFQKQRYGQFPEVYLKWLGPLWQFAGLTNAKLCKKGLIGNEQLSIEIQSTIAKFHFFPSFYTYLLFVPLIFLLLFYLETIRPFCITILIETQQMVETVTWTWVEIHRNVTFNYTEGVQIYQEIIQCLIKQFEILAPKQYWRSRLIWFLEISTPIKLI